ncbi:hypothetical protein CFO_g5610 [Ceratocystis platani]|uniref:Uncharacterized protein n=1 Tax=Ceratocystis fimbriata f. sp. platani TaxID=88771 RepID=A0A0F8BIP8_CERFI|nr:hypothetical protein CFO_g5610 [Ceratocystis platani]
MAMKHIAEEKKRAELKGNVYLWLAEKIPEICNQAISMAKGDADVRMLAGHVSAEFRAAFQKLQLGGRAPNPGQMEKKRQSPEANKATKPEGTTAQKQEAPSGKRTYATVAKQATGGTKQPVAQKKTTIKTPGKEGEQTVRVFIRGPAEGKEEAANRELAKIFGGTPKELNAKKVNSGWAFHAKKSTVTDANMERARIAYGAKACEVDKKWIHARITGLEDFYVLGEEGPVPIRTEQWFAEHIAKQTGGQNLSAAPMPHLLGTTPHGGV